MDPAFSPDGKRIVVGCQGMVLHNHATLTVWDATSGTQTLALKGHNSMVLTVAYSPDGKRIVSGDAEGELKIWDASKGQETFTLKANSGGVFTLAFSRDGKRLVSGADGTLKVWDALLRPGKAPKAGRKTRAFRTLRERSLPYVRRHPHPFPNRVRRPDGRGAASAAGL